jgi:hypothetical protein
MKKKKITHTKTKGILAFALFLAVLYLIFNFDVFSVSYSAMASSTAGQVRGWTEVQALTEVPVLDKELYDKKMIELANYLLPSIASTTRASSTSSTSVAAKTATSTPVKHLWPAKAVYPNAGALLPFNRIVAYYGNFYSKKMGVLGEYPTEQMLQMLRKEAERWTLADPGTPVIPAIHYIAATAQGSPGEDGKYRLRMPADQIQKAIDLANEIHGIVFLDIQVGLSNVQAELPLLKEYLKLPNVHLALDPEFSMKSSNKPGTVIGTMDAADINYASNFLAEIVKENKLSPKILVVHRFTQHMVTRSSLINTLPEVQIVMDMDGWGGPAHKKKAYNDVIYDEPVQFTGLKLFYKNDVKAPSTGMLTIKEILKMQPRPSYIQYQ